MKHWKKPFTILLLALAACLLLGMSVFAAEEATAVKGFNDIAGTEYESDITVMYTMGLTVGYTDGSYRPGRAYSRLEVAQLTQGLLGLDAPEGYILPFTDTEDAVSRDAVAAAVAGGYMGGRSDTTFDPYGSVLKAEFMSVLTKIAEALGTEDLISRLDEELALWAEDFSVITAGEAMHAARAMIGALETKTADAGEPAASEEPSGEMPAEVTGEEADLAEAPAAEAAESIEEETIEETPIAEEPAAEEIAALPTDETAVPEAETVDVSETTAASEEPAASAEPSGEMTASQEPAAEEATQAQTEAPAAPQGVLSPAATTPTPAPATTVQPQVAAQPETPAATAPATTPTMTQTTQTTQTPDIDPDDPGAEMKSTVYSFYANIRDQLVSFFSDLLG